MYWGRHLESLDLKLKFAQICLPLPWAPQAPQGSQHSTPPSSVGTGTCAEGLAPCRREHGAPRPRSTQSAESGLLPLASRNLAGYSNSPTSLKDPSRFGNPLPCISQKRLSHSTVNKTISFSIHGPSRELSTWGET